MGRTNRSKLLLRKNELSQTLQSRKLQTDKYVEYYCYNFLLTFFLKTEQNNE